MTVDRSTALRRRTVLTGSGATGAALLLGSGTREAAASPVLWSRHSRAGAPGVTGVHLQFGADAAREMAVSWLTPEPVRRPRIHLGTLGGGFGRTVAADTRSYRDGLSRTEVFVHHARLDGLRPAATYTYAAVHEGATPETGVFTMAPHGRSPFTFTSFGDQGTHDLRRIVKLPDGVPSPTGPYPLHTSSQVGSPASSDIVAAIERIGPLFNLVNGDLCYASVGGLFGQDRVATWADWFTGNSRSTRFRPWMPCAGNHENERGNGPLGAAAYQAYYDLPHAGSTQETRGLWYAFTVGSVRVISLANDDVAIQDGGDSYLRGFSGGAQRRWLERELRRSRADAAVDWIVVCMHQPVISSARRSNGSDLGVRAAWGPLFDAYGVDLVLSGHDHHYERSHPVRGALPNDTRTPVPAATRQDVIDTSRGTVHMVIGGGGNFATSYRSLFERPRGRVIVARSDEQSPDLPDRKDSVWLEEDAPWASVQDREHPHGFAAFDVDPGDRHSTRTRIRVTYYTFHGPYAELKPVDTFTLERPRGDAG
ncbi:purple acid phosphatase family protein [Streptomyces iconiensis]|uniref:Metallophosphoesterase family protein n=1 Tax=Streptomyces iconiensis TaxID=1384038 RepID=A0ABT7A4B1_9ACTN|nr:metallophosphoesterase family protein [Streptomyces iconiensis]MDJ1135882.1 metallophosphoesterase family protein [Streptomyces iconiensis]